MTESLFNFINLLPMPVWLAMILFPKARFTQRMVTSSWLFIGLGAVYVLLLLTSIMVGAMNGTGGIDFSTVGIQRGFNQPWGLLTGWMHYLALDLFAGVWIFRDAKYWNIRTTLYLILTLFAGPLGLALYLLIRERKNKIPTQRIVN